MQEMNGNFYSTPPIMESSVADATSPILALPKAAEKAFFFPYSMCKLKSAKESMSIFSLMYPATFFFS